MNKSSTLVNETDSEQGEIYHDLIRTPLPMFLTITKTVTFYNWPFVIVYMISFYSVQL